MSPTTCPRLPMSRWLTCGLYSTSCFPLLRFWFTLTWTLSGIFSFLVSFLQKNNRDDEDREINHHGRPVEVGEPENMQQANNVIKVFWNKNNHNGNFSHTKKIIFASCVKVAENDLVSVDERIQQKALKTFYSRWLQFFSILPNPFSSNHWKRIDFIDP